LPIQDFTFLEAFFVSAQHMRCGRDECLRRKANDTPAGSIDLPSDAQWWSENDRNGMVSRQPDHLPIDGKVACLLIWGKPPKLVGACDFVHIEIVCEFASELWDVLFSNGSSLRGEIGAKGAKLESKLMGEAATIADWAATRYRWPVA
jgi:hypothetical protein